MECPIPFSTLKPNCRINTAKGECRLPFLQNKTCMWRGSAFGCVGTGKSRVRPPVVPLPGNNRRQTNLARSAKLPEGLYILPMFFLYFFYFFF